MEINRDRIRNINSPPLPVLHCADNNAGASHPSIAYKWLPALPGWLLCLDGRAQIGILNSSFLKKKCMCVLLHDHVCAGVHGCDLGIIS